MDFVGGSPVVPSVGTVVVAALGAAGVAYWLFLFVRNNWLGGLVRDNEPPRTCGPRVRVACLMGRPA
jgi:hypothetical protein